MEQSIIDALIGPAGGFVMLVGILLSLYKLIVTHVFPLASAWIKDQRDNFKEIMREHAKDREIFKDSITILARRQDRLEDVVETIKIDLKEIKEKI
jgi:hypothetical protein